MKDTILKLFAEKPKAYVRIIERDIALKRWVEDNSLIKSDRFVEHIYSAVHQKSNICKNGNVMHLDRFSTGFVGCGPAKTCECTRENIAINVSKSKLSISEEEKEAINNKRKETMLEKFGYEYNSQRPEVKPVLSKPKIPEDVHNKLTDYDWLNTEYNTNKRTLLDIADELKIHYSTVGEYCLKFNFNIRQVSNYSLTERAISNFIKSLGVEVIENDWDILETAEIDILIPKFKLGIEVDGLYYHSFHPTASRQEDRMRHINKTRKAKEKGIDLIHITDYQWNNQTEIVKNLIRTKLQRNEKIYARECTIKEVDKNTEKSFLDQYHFQGYVPSQYAFGLFHNDQLVSMITIGQSRFDKSVDFELLRVCSKAGITVVGGLSKLFKHIEQMFKGKSLLTYCSLDHSTGSSYEQLGMSLVKTTEPGYFWNDGTHVFSRYKCQKTQLKSWLKNFDPNLTERENMFNAGYRIFWDCGNNVYTKTF